MTAEARQSLGDPSGFLLWLAPVQKKAWMYFACVVVGTVGIVKFIPVYLKSRYHYHGTGRSWGAILYMYLHSIVDCVEGCFQRAGFRDDAIVYRGFLPGLTVMPYKDITHLSIDKVYHNLRIRTPHDYINLRAWTLPQGRIQQAYDFVKARQPAASSANPPLPARMADSIAKTLILGQFVGFGLFIAFLVTRDRWLHGR